MLPWKGRQGVNDGAGGGSGVASGRLIWCIVSCLVVANNVKEINFQLGHFNHRQNHLDCQVQQLLVHFSNQQKQKRRTDRGQAQQRWNILLKKMNQLEFETSFFNSQKKDEDVV